MPSYHVTIVLDDFPFEANDDEHARHVAGNQIDAMVRKPAPGTPQLGPDLKVIISDPTGQEIDRTTVAAMIKKPKT